MRRPRYAERRASSPCRGRHRHGDVPGADRCRSGRAHAAAGSPARWSTRRDAGRCRARRRTPRAEWCSRGGCCAGSSPIVSGVDFQVGALDITFYRDDIGVRGGRTPRRTAHGRGVESSRLPARRPQHDRRRRRALHGRTIQAAMKALFDYGQPRRCGFAVLCNQQLPPRAFPFRADFVGRSLRGLALGVSPCGLVEVDKVEEHPLEGAPMRRCTPRHDLDAAASPPPVVRRPEAPPTSSGCLDLAAPRGRLGDRGVEDCDPARPHRRRRVPRSVHIVVVRLHRQRTRRHHVDARPRAGASTPTRPVRWKRTRF